VTLLHSLLLALAAASLAAAALRLASRAVPSGLERVLSAAVVAVAAATAEALVLGWLGLGMDAVALTGAAVLTYVAARLALPAPETALARELRRWWEGAGRAIRLAAGGLLGGALATLAAFVLRPTLGFDTFLYHLPIAVTWVQQGDPGAVNAITPRFAVGAYPSLDELALAWSAAIARSFVPFSVWPFGLLAITASGGWLGLRSLGVARPAAALAVCALVVSQQVVGWQHTGASTDPASLAWLVAAGALCAASIGRQGRAPRPALLPPALLAAALAVGTKPTVAPLALVALVAAARVHRRDLRTIVRPLAWAAAGGTLVGGWWYVRNLALYGSPLWPFYATPWGTTEPPALRAAPTFVNHLHETVSAVGTRYLETFGGGLLLICAALLAPLLDRRRMVLWSAGATAIALIAWASTPNTGLRAPASPILVLGTLSTTRYLVGGVAAAALTVALVTTRMRAARYVAYAVLAVAATIDVAQTFDLGRPSVPSGWIVLGGAAAGALAVAALGRTRLPAPGRRAAAALTVAATVALPALALAAVTPRYLDRLAGAGLAGQPDGELLRWFRDQPGYDDGSRPIAILPLRQSVFAGPRLDHTVDLVTGASCAELRRRARRGWVVVWGARAPTLSTPRSRRPLRCFDGTAPVYRDAVHDVFATG
jgi:hypothetical protein